MESTKKISIVFPKRTASWEGGKYYLSSLQTAALELERSGFLKIMNRNSFASDWLSKYSSLRNLSRSAELIRGFYGLNVPWPLTRLSPKSMFWIPDCQDLEMPEFFSPEEIKNREVDRKRAIENGRAIFFSSNTARSVFEFNFGSVPNIAGIVRFTTPLRNREAIGAGVAGNSCAECKTVGYFYLPNQWWIHKNHSVALEAFSMYQKNGGNHHMILTGAKDDFRWPGYRAKLESLISKTPGVHDFGFVSRIEQQDLYENAVATLQPSLYEGWSTTIEESLFHGTPVICSDIPILREQLLFCKDVSFFNPESPYDLLERLFSPPKSLFAETIELRNGLRWDRFVSDLKHAIQVSHQFIQGT